MPHPPKTETKKEKAPKPEPATTDKVAAAKPVVEKKVAKGAKKA